MMLQVIEAQEDMPILSAVTLYSSLLKFTLHVHPDRLDYADQVLVSFLIATVFTYCSLLKSSLNTLCSVNVA